MKSIESHPGAGVFRSTIVIILILVCIISFFVFTEKLSQQAEEVAKDQVLVEMKQALAMMLYDYAIKGQLMALEKFDRENPFVPLAIYRELPKNYKGAINSERQLKDVGWYFDLNTKVAIYKFSDNQIPLSKYVLKFEYDDLNSDGVFSNNDAGYLQVVEWPD